MPTQMQALAAPATASRSKNSNPGSSAQRGWVASIFVIFSLAMIGDKKGEYSGGHKTPTIDNNVFLAASAALSPEESADYFKSEPLLRKLLLPFGYSPHFV